MRYLILSLMILTTGCSLQKLTADQTADALYTGQSAMESEEDIEFARTALPGSLKTVETFLQSSPENEKFLEMLAKGYFSYAFGFIEWDLERAEIGAAEEETIDLLRSRAVIHYMRSSAFGWRLLDNEDVQKAATSGNRGALVKALKTETDVDDVPGLFWAAYGWGAAINLSQDNPDMVAQQELVVAMMERVVELDADYFFGGPLLFFAVYHLSVPPALGGKPEKAKQYFDSAMKRFGNKNLLVPYLGARFYAATMQDAPLFKSLLNRVKSADLDAYPNLRLNNAIAKERAIFWLKNSDELILE